jgi:hypothetical protein
VDRFIRIKFYSNYNFKIRLPQQAAEGLTEANPYNTVQKKHRNSITILISL